MEFKQYLHNKGQLSILQEEMIKNQKQKIKILEEELAIKDQLIASNKEIIKSQRVIINLSGEGYKTLEKLTEKKSNLFSWL